MRYTYPNKARLKRRKIIGALFSQNQGISKYPLRMVWLENIDLPEGVWVQTAVSVSKKRFKHAVKRNLLKRRMREAIRLNIHKLEPFLKEHDKKLVFMLIFTSNEVLSYVDIENALNGLFLSIIRKLSDKKDSKQNTLK